MPRVPDLYRERSCPDCGRIVIMHIKSKRCRACQDAANRAHDAEYQRARSQGKTRKLGSIDICQRCGGQYVVNSGMQRYCPDCAPSAVSDNVRASARQRYADAYQTPESRAERNARRRRQWQQDRVCKQCSKAFVPQYPRQVCCCESCKSVRNKAIIAVSEQKRRIKNRSKEDQT